MLTVFTAKVNNFRKIKFGKDILGFVSVGHVYSLYLKKSVLNMRQIVRL